MSEPKETHNTAEDDVEPEAMTEAGRPEAEVASPQESAPHKKQRKFKLPHLTLLTGLLVLAVTFNLIGIVANGYLRYKVAATTNTTLGMVSIPKAANASQKPAVTPTAATLHYVSNGLHVEFDYPVDWRIAGTADDMSLTLNSAPFNMLLSDGKRKQGAIELTIADPSQDHGGFGYLSNDDVISVGSQALPYTNPTQVQRKTTDVSFAGYSNNAEPVTEFIFVSGNLAYKVGDTVGSKDYTSITPHLYARFTGCGIVDFNCHYFDSTPISQTVWQTDPNFIKLRDLISSLRFSQ